MIPKRNFWILRRAGRWIQGIFFDIWLVQRTGQKKGFAKLPRRLIEENYWSPAFTQRLEIWKTTSDCWYKVRWRGSFGEAASIASPCAELGWLWFCWFLESIWENCFFSRLQKWFAAQKGWGLALDAVCTFQNRPVLAIFWIPVLGKPPSRFLAATYAQVTCFPFHMEACSHSQNRRKGTASSKTYSFRLVLNAFTLLIFLDLCSEVVKWPLSRKNITSFLLVACGLVSCQQSSLPWTPWTPQRAALQRYPCCMQTLDKKGLVRPDGVPTMAVRGRGEAVCISTGEETPETDRMARQHGNWKTAWEIA